MGTNGCHNRYGISSISSGNTHFPGTVLGEQERHAFRDEILFIREVVWEGGVVE